MFLANFAHARIMFIRDPLHRMSNTFVRGIQGCPPVHVAVVNCHILHKLKRAPYGTKRFWAKFCSVLNIFLTFAPDDHPWFDEIQEGVAFDHDHNELPELFARDRDRLRACMREMIDAPAQDGVDFRRWFTNHTMGPGLRKHWQQLLSD